ncbi:MAG TPA: NAD-dependent epimerase/dehydratase family protein [Burkholderiaceae bacterium]|nr:NAD-dependent epimerase/dehydratase family protein [Burkholderiaceae bacterium]
MPDPAILVTGAAGFIGSFVAARLSQQGHAVHGCDNFNAYYDPALKRARVAHLLAPRGVHCNAVELADAAAVRALFEAVRPSLVVHLAAQAGVRYSIDHPETYVQSNLVGFANVLEACRHHRVQHLVYASSSSVYGDRTDPPFRETQNTDSPVSLYAATKKANELMAHTYSHLYGLRATGLRFFTVYGPWGRPDMAAFSFAEKLLAGQPLPVFGHGTLQRDFTYIDDIVEGVVRVAFAAPPATTPAHEIFNIGNHTPVTVLKFIETLAGTLGVEPELQMLPAQPGDVTMTCADVTRLRERVGFEPSTPLDEGLRKFVVWLREWKSGALA